MAMAALFGERVGSCSLLGECCPRLSRAWSVRSRRERGETKGWPASGQMSLAGSENGHSWLAEADRRPRLRAERTLGLSQACEHDF